jgi:kanamycin nucleotidyltransferase
VAGDWSITHGQFAGVWVLHDPTHLFPRLERLAFSQPLSSFEHAITEVIVGDIYELIGKLRNAQVRQQVDSLPLYLVLLAQHAACLVGLANRHVYASSASLLSDSLQLADCPPGYQALCQAVLSGELNDPHQVMKTAEDFWHGVLAWADRRRLPLATSLADLLAQA